MVNQTLNYFAGIHEGGVKEQYQVTIRNKFAALENLEHSGAWANIRENIKISFQKV
jgi:hypothetical protein